MTESARDERQQIVSHWCENAFGADQASSIPQRGIRLLEEAIETYQACGCEESMGHTLMAYVFSKPAGAISQELGGVGVTVLALAEAAGFSADDVEQAEVKRVLSKPLEYFTKRNQAKNEAGFEASTASSSEATQIHPLYSASDGRYDHPGTGDPAWQATQQTWRVGGKVPLNVYEDDLPMFQCHTPEDAARVVALLNLAPQQAAPFSSTNPTGRMSHTGGIPFGQTAEQASGGEAAPSESKLQKRLERALADLQMIADWPFDIQGDCVADARLVARKAVFGDPHKHAIDCSYRQLRCSKNCNCPRRHS